MFSGYNSSAQQAGGYGSPAGGYNSSAQPGGYGSNPAGGYTSSAQQASGYPAPAGVYTSSAGGYAPPVSGYTSSAGGYGAPVSTTQVTQSVATQGMFAPRQSYYAHRHHDAYIDSDCNPMCCTIL